MPKPLSCRSAMLTALAPLCALMCCVPAQADSDRSGTEVSAEFVRNANSSAPDGRSLPPNVPRSGLTGARLAVLGAPTTITTLRQTSEELLAVGLTHDRQGMIYFHFSQSSQLGDWKISPVANPSVGNAIPLTRSQRKEPELNFHSG